MNGLKTAALLCALLLIASPAAASAGDELDRGDYIRLHVVADDDSALRQGEKLAVRDGVRQAANALLADCRTADEAFARLSKHTDDLESAAQAVLDDWNSALAVSVETGVFAFPDRQYGALLLPAGDYRAVRVVLGRGEGHNWWCVLYPSLCLEADGESEKTVIFYSSVARWLQSVFSGNEANAWPSMPSENVLNAASWLNALPESSAASSSTRQPDDARLLSQGGVRDASPQPPISARIPVRAADRRGALREAIA